MNITCVLDKDISQLYESFDNNDQWNIINNQSYNPILEKCFNIKNNLDNVHYLRLNHKYMITKFHSKTEGAYIFDIKNTLNNVKENSIPIFVKTCHLIDPIRYMMDEYLPINYSRLPYLQTQKRNFNKKIQDPNNKAYIDSFFCFLSSKLVENDICPHFPIFYGQHCGISKSYEYDISEDLYSIKNLSWFHKNLNKLFTIGQKQNNSLIMLNKQQIINDYELSRNNSVRGSFYRHGSFKMINDNIDDIVSIGDNNIELEDYLNDDKHSCVESVVSNDTSPMNRSDTQSPFNKSILSYDNSTDEDDEEDNEYICILKDFPVMTTYLEKCIGTLEDLCDIKPQLDVWGSYLFQIIFTLSIAQQYYDFTHNDLHCNNIMYQKTDKTFLYYQVSNVYFKIPTFGMIIKIIDFGRAIYNYNNKLLCSDSFSSNGTAPYIEYSGTG